MRVVFAFFILFVCLAGPTLAQAQDLAPDPSRTAIMPEEREAQRQAEAKAKAAEQAAKEAQTAKSTKDLDLSKASDGQIEEAQRFFKSCTKNEDLSYDHDCRCLAGEFLANRMTLGDSVPAKEVYAAVRHLCAIDPNTKRDGDEQVGLGEEYTDEELDEAQTVYKNCMSDQLMSLNHDCRCLASTFIQKRKTRGRIPKADEILATMRSECKNGTELAGYLYTDCINKPEFLPPVVSDPKKFCECYASGYAKEFEKTTVENNVNTRSAIAMIVMGTCQNDQRTMSGQGAKGSQ